MDKILIRVALEITCCFVMALSGTLAFQNSMATFSEWFLTTGMMKK
jgi:hypothetical protein